MASSKVIVHHPPVQVVVMVTPWNFPAAMITRKVARRSPPYVRDQAAGRSTTPALRVAQLLEEAGVPASLVNVVPTSTPVRGSMPPPSIVPPAWCRSPARLRSARSCSSAAPSRPQGRDGARRQCSAGRVRGRRSRPGCRGRHDRQDASLCRGLHCGEPHVCARRRCR